MLRLFVSGVVRVTSYHLNRWDVLFVLLRLINIVVVLSVVFFQDQNRGRRSFEQICFKQRCQQAQILRPEVGHHRWSQVFISGPPKPRSGQSSFWEVQVPSSLRERSSQAELRRLQIDHQVPDERHSSCSRKRSSLDLCRAGGGRVLDRRH